MSPNAEQQLSGLDKLNNLALKTPPTPEEVGAIVVPMMRNLETKLSLANRSVNGLENADVGAILIIGQIRWLSEKSVWHHVKHVRL